METQIEPIDADQSFQFGCHAGVSCFNECCRDLNQFLTPYDILRLKTGLGISSGEFLDTYTLQHDGPETGLPVVTLKPADREEKICPFVTPDGCLVYEDRPSSCRAYPVMRAISRNRDTGRITEHFAVIHECHCRGFSENVTHTVREWIQKQGCAEYFVMNDRLMEIIGMKNQFRPRLLGIKERLMFRTALYDLDLFREQVVHNGLLDPLNVGSEKMETMRSDDTLLLEYAHRWVEFAFFGNTQGFNRQDTS